MKKLKIGVLGAYRGSGVINYCESANHAEVVAICDKNPDTINRHKAIHGDKITYYSDFDEFLKHEMDAVFLANYANEHAPFAIKCLKAGKHVYSEVLPVQHMKEAVELVEAVEESGLVYSFAENFCYMRAPWEMKKLYEEGKIGEFEYGECEYVHNLEPIAANVTYGEPDHWRNTMYSTYYCTHSLGPIIHATGLRPVSVIGIEGTKNERNVRAGALGGQFGMEIVTLENGGIIKSLHGGLYKNSHWYCMYGSKGRMESARDDADEAKYNKIYVNIDEVEADYKEKDTVECYKPVLPRENETKLFAHGGSDYYTIYNFIEKCLGNNEVDVIDVYEALDMGLCGMFAYRSILDGNKPKKIPNLRNKEERDKWRNDTSCVDKKAAGDMLLPSFSLGNPEIPESVYTALKEKHRSDLENNSSGYVRGAFNQSSVRNGKK